MVIIHYKRCLVAKESLTDSSLVYVDLMRFKCVDRTHAKLLAEQIDKCVDVVTL